MSIESVSSYLDNFKDIKRYVDQKKKRNKVLDKEKRILPFPETNFNDSFNIDWKYERILEILLLRPGLNVKDTVNEIIKEESEKGFYRRSNTNAEYNEYRKFLRMMEDLEDLCLIEKIEEKGQQIGGFPISSIHYRLSSTGIVYIILNYHLFGYLYVLPRLLDEYVNNIVFLFFLYPYIKRETLLQIPMSLSYTILEYLRDICKLIVNHIGLERNTNKNFENGRSEMILLYWPDKDSDDFYKFNDKKFMHPQFKQFLHVKFKWKWLLDASVITDYKNNRIELKSQSDESHLTIEISPENNKSVLIVNGIKHNDIFRIVKVQNYFVILGSYIESDGSRNIFDWKFEQRLLILFFDIRRQNDPQINQVINNDKEFREYINKIVNLFKI